MTPLTIINSLEADINYLFDPLWEYWNSHFYTTHLYFIVLGIMVNQLVTQ